MLFLERPDPEVETAKQLVHEGRGDYADHLRVVLKHAETYEIMRPLDVGVPENSLVLGKHSGRHAFSNRLEQLGFAVEREKMEELFVQFKALGGVKTVRRQSGG